ncbi:MAG TPA: protease inhibitor I42 family protein [Candidatus Baltobacteraceae bacterium]|nr:protease inhibitor I42 family protein [Candidatus Baltobacteraceae bacterium]
MSAPLGDPENDARIDARVGEPLEISFSENGTTGYQWGVDAHEMEADVDSTYEPDGGAAGAGGRRVFRIVPRHAGEQRLTFSLKRSWSPQPIDQRTVHVSVAG